MLSFLALGVCDKDKGKGFCVQGMDALRLAVRRMKPSTRRIDGEMAITIRKKTCKLWRKGMQLPRRRPHPRRPTRPISAVSVAVVAVAVAVAVAVIRAAFTIFPLLRSIRWCYNLFYAHTPLLLRSSKKRSWVTSAFFFGHLILVTCQLASLEEFLELPWPFADEKHAF